MIPVLTEKQKNKFYSKLFPALMSECIEYEGRKNEDGYGVIDINDQSFMAHRIAFFLHIHIDPGENLVCHSCDNPPCCNINHLFLGTKKSNCLDSVKKGRHSSKILRGETRPNSKLKEKDIPIIRFKYGMGFSLMELGEEFNVDYTTIGQIVNFKTWKFIK